MKIFEKSVNQIGAFLMLLSLGFYILATVAIQRDVLNSTELVLGTTVFVLLLYFLWAMSKAPVSDRWNSIIIFLFSVFFLLGWNYFYNPRPVLDYEVLWTGARQMVEGSFRDRAIRLDDYFCFYRYQITYTWYLSLIYRAFHGMLWGAKLVEVFVIAATNVVCFKTLRLYCEKRIAFLGAWLFVLYPYIFMGAGILNNQHECLLFESLAIYFYLKQSGKWQDIILSAVCLCAACFMRPTAYVVVIAFALVSFLMAIIKKSKRYLMMGIILLGAYWIVIQLLNQIFIRSGIAPYGFVNSNIWNEISLGLTGKGITAQESTDVEHTSVYYDLMTFGFDYDAYVDGARDYIVGLIRDNKLDFSFIWRKIIYFAGGVDSQYAYADMTFNDAHPVLIGTMCVAGIWMYFSSLVLSWIRCLRSRVTDDLTLFLPALIFGGYFLCYIMFEAQTRYRYEQYYMLFLMGVPCWKKIRELFVSFRYTLLRDAKH